MKHANLSRTAAVTALLALSMMMATACDSGAQTPTTADTSAPVTEKTGITIALDFAMDGMSGETLTADSGESVTLPVPSADGYEFAGWQDANGDISNGSYLVGSACTLTAQWVKLYTLTFDGTGSALTLHEGDAIDSLADAGSKDGFVFRGWNTAADGSGKTYIEGETMGAEDVTLYAVWREAATLTFDETVSVSNALYAVGETAGELPTAAMNDYAFLGWNTAADGSGEMITADTVITGDVQLYAQWTDGRMLNFGNELFLPYVNYNTKNTTGASGVSIASVSYADESISYFITGENCFMSVPMRNMKLTGGHVYRITYNYTVNGEPGDNARLTLMPYDSKNQWGADYYRECTENGEEYEVNEDYTLISLRPGTTGAPELDSAVVYDHIYVMDITEYEGASMPMLNGKTETSRCAAVGAAIGELPVMTRDGYTFAGWNTEKDGSGETYTADTVMGDSNITLWPQFTKN